MDGNGTSRPISISLRQPFDGPTRIQAIQTLATETRARTSLDLAMLVQLPLTNTAGTPVSGILGTGAVRSALIRNPNFEANPDGPASGYAGWSLVSDGLPAGASRFWVSGGHTSPSYFVYADNSNTACPNGLFRLTTDLATVGKVSRTWRCLISELSQVPSSALYGPAFINPFDPNIIFVSVAATSGSSGSIRMSSDGGAHFCVLPALTALVTESGRFTIANLFNPDAAFQPLGSRFHGNPFSILEQISFDRHTPSHLLVASPYTGLFYGVSEPTSSGRSSARSCAESSWAEPNWFNLSPHMPQPATYVSDAAILGDAAVVATRGRGIFALSGIRGTQPATYFVPRGHAASDAPIASLRRSDKVAVAWGRVAVTAMTAKDRRRVLTQVEVRSDADGQVRLPSKIAAGTYVVGLHFMGDGTLSQSRTSFALTITP